MFDDGSMTVEWGRPSRHCTLASVAHSHRHTARVMFKVLLNGLAVSQSACLSHGKTVTLAKSLADAVKNLSRVGVK